MLDAINRIVDDVDFAIASIDCEQLVSPNFLIMNFIEHAMKRNAKVICWSTMSSENASRLMAKKLMIRLTEKVKFVQVDQCLSDELNTDDRFFIDAAVKVVTNITEEDTREVFLIFDNVLAITSLLDNPGNAPQFFRRLQNAVSTQGMQTKLVLTFPTKDSCSPMLIHNSDVIFKIKKIGNGFAKDVTGQLTLIRHVGEPPYAQSVYNYHLTSRAVFLALPGMSRPEL